ncbi:MAG: cytochrome c oxidase accessory protein CcoG [Bacteroidetes bacterium CG12_big_fil_rev_8_21_14_0_65_60_17]|nr:MAG: cytochrome c oxidase accessory protein CcoG [Bacteroidetes bacterium CG12_big_fil_rev_8_21_14_0_65_60_17]
MADGPQILQSPEEVLSTLGQDGKRKWLYPIESKGRFLIWRRWAGFLLVVLYLALPVVHIGGKPAILLDVVHREFALFGTVFYPTDTLLLMLMLIAVMVAVVLFTALLGRVWCGWACPQTVYLEFVFRPIERLFEGREHVRKRRDEGPWSFDKFWRKALKWGTYAAISLLLANTFVAYFVGWEALLTWMQAPPTENWGFFLVMSITTGLILFDFGIFREQMCTITCPYARMQSIMLDEDSMIVSYDPGRGEPRSKRSKKQLRMEQEGTIPQQGDCIDCFACVRTCPTGIDIRDGLQMECVACTQCIDACDHIMDNIGKPRGLIRYTSERELEGGKTRLLRPRTVVYAAALVFVLSAFSLVLSQRSDFDVNIGRAVGEPYAELGDGRIANRLRFRVRNQTPQPASFSIRTAEGAPLELRPVGALPMTLTGGEMRRIEVWVMAPASAFNGDTMPATFLLEFSDGNTVERTFTLLGPSAR